MVEDGGLVVNDDEQVVKDGFGGKLGWRMVEDGGLVVNNGGFNV